MRLLNFDEMDFVSGAADQEKAPEPVQQVVITAPRPSTNAPCEPGMYRQSQTITQPVYTVTGGGSGGGTLTVPRPEVNAEINVGVSRTSQTVQTVCVSPQVTCPVPGGGTVTKPGTWCPPVQQ